jgi:hypothetical protein
MIESMKRSEKTVLGAELLNMLKRPGFLRSNMLKNPIKFMATASDFWSYFGLGIVHSQGWKEIRTTKGQRLMIPSG